MNLVDFLNGTSPDHQGRYLRDIWDFNDRTIEHTHDFIQWMFPLTEKSLSVPGVPTLSATDIEAIRSSDVARANLERSAQWYLGFLQRNNHWIRSYDHNHLRVTRMVKCVRLVFGGTRADVIKKSVFQITGGGLNHISDRTLRYWEDA